MPKLKEQHEQYAAKLKELRDLAAKAETENRDFTADERQEVVRRTEELKALKAEIAEAGKDDELRKAIAQLGDQIGLNDPDDRKDLPPGSPGKGSTIGEQFTSSPEFKAFMGQFPNGRIPDSAKGIMSAPVQFKEILTGGDSTSAGVFVEPDQTGIYEPFGRRPLTIRDLVSNRTTGSDTVEYVRQTSILDAAAVVPEASGNVSGTGDGTVSGEKPHGNFSFVKVAEPVKTIAVWVPATKRALSDAAQLRGLIDDELRSDLAEELEDQILLGDGEGEDFTGILETSGIQEQPFDEDLFTTTRKAKTRVRVNGRATASAYAFHPNDWERIELTQDNEGRYFYGGPLAGEQPRHWRLPAVESEAIPEGTGLVGDFSKAVLWNREQASIQVSDSHADFFIRNLVAILAEGRWAFGVTRPAAFVTFPLEPNGG